jgi:hypothetical protein
MKMNAMMKVVWSSVMLTGLMACAPEERGVDADDQPLDGLPDWAEQLPSGKADNASALTLELGELALGDDAAITQTFEGTARVHIYTMALREGAEVSFETTQKGSNRGIDTSLFVFAPQQDTGAAVNVIASDGDSGWGKLSRIESFTAPAEGTYTVWVMKENTTSPNRYRVKAECLSDACGVSSPVLSTDECVFGPTINHVFEALGPVQVISSRRLGLLDDFDMLQAQQLIAAVGTTYDNVTTTADAFGQVDQQEIHRLELWDASSRQSLIAFKFWAGDNLYGAIMRPDNDTIVARIQDGDIAECTQGWGPEQQVCTHSDECGAGVFCFGMHDGQGACFDPQASSPSGAGDDCTSSEECEEGLVCAGETVNAGFCVDAWMRRGFSGVDPDESLEVPDGAGALVLQTNVSGLASVSTDVHITLHLDHNAPDTVRIKLTNPSGTESIIHDAVDASTFLAHVPVFGFPGDEDANGTWTLEIEDSATGDKGYLSHYTLEVTSRFD